MEDDLPWWGVCSDCGAVTPWGRCDSCFTIWVRQKYLGGIYEEMVITL